MPAPVDIAPGLAEDILQAMKDSLSGNSELKGLTNKLARGTATLEDAHRVSQITGNAASEALKAVLDPAILPDGRLYYNIGSRTVTPAIEYANNFTSEYTRTVQNTLYKKNGINIKTVSPSLDTESINNLVGMMDNAQNFADATWMLDNPVKEHVSHFVDRFVKVNSKVAEEAGLHPMLIRTAEPNCCEWCANLEGEYNYWEVNKGDDVWKRHNGCECYLEFVPTVGPSKSVWG